MEHIQTIFMKNLDFYTGRLGNRLFQFAKLYALSREEGTDYYYQDPKHFDKYKDEIKALFSEGIGYLPYVAMHVRRGKNPINPDEPAYSENPFYTNLLATDYYAKAIDQFPPRKFLIFSDDMEWCKANFQGEIFGYDESETDLESFNKMASCEAIITSNSSFSWWCAFLGDDKKKVICPSETSWFADGQVRTKVPPEWIQLSPTKLPTP